MTPRPFLICGSARHLALRDGSVQTCITSPPYWGLRDYGVAGQLGLEATPDEYVANMVDVGREIRRVLRPDGTLWLNLGDCYAGAQSRGGPPSDKSTLRGNGHVGGGPKIKSLSALQIEAAPKRTHTGSIPPGSGLKPKDLVGIPWRVAFALQADGWWLRDVIIWAKPNPMPSSVTDRTTTAHEYVFLLTKSVRYFYDADAIREPVTSTGGACVGKQKHDASGTGAQSRKFADPSERNNPLGRNKRSVWSIPTFAFPGAHFATFPPRLVEPMIRAGTSERGCCPKCAAPWKRVVEKVPVDGRGGERKQTEAWERVGNSSAFVTGDWKANVTVNWLPSCACHAGDPVPCVVLDPFVGSGTTVMVAAKLGRRGIGVDRNPKYLGMARDRIAEELGRPAKRPKRRRSPKAEPDLFTFKGVA